MNKKTLAQIIVISANAGSKLYGSYITNRFYGRSAKEQRRAVMTAIEGRKMPITKCGHSAVREAIIRTFNIDITGLCSAEIDIKIDTTVRAAAEA